MKKKITVLGAGSWGTALAILLAKNNHRVTLWGRNADLMREMADNRCNATYLPGFDFPESLIPCVDLKQALQDYQTILLAVPSHVFRGLLQQISPLLEQSNEIVWASKGFDPESKQQLDQVIREILPSGQRLAVLSGPSFATEVAQGLPTAVTLASDDADFARRMALDFTNDNFRVYLSDDIRGVQLGGAVKNVLAIACGISDGLGFGANARSALITRGLAEMQRLGAALGAEPSTFTGLAGLGDLVLTCTDNQSRNRRFGLALGQGISAEQATQEIGQVVEGITTAKQVHHLAQQYQVDMPISAQIFSVIYENLTPQSAVKNLLQRAIKRET